MDARFIDVDHRPLLGSSGSGGSNLPAVSPPRGANKNCCRRSTRKSRLTKPLHMMHTSSKKMTGLASPAADSGSLREKLLHCFRLCLLSPTAA